MNPNDNVAQGSGNNTPNHSHIDAVTQWTDIQEASFDEVRGHCIDSTAIVQDSPTALLIYPKLSYVSGLH